MRMRNDEMFVKPLSEEMAIEKVWTAIFKRFVRVWNFFTKLSFTEL